MSSHPHPARDDLNVYTHPLKVKLQTPIRLWFPNQPNHSRWCTVVYRSGAFRASSLPAPLSYLLCLPPSSTASLSSFGHQTAVSSRHDSSPSPAILLRKRLIGSSGSESTVDSRPCVLLGQCSTIDCCDSSELVGMDDAPRLSLTILNAKLLDPSLLSADRTSLVNLGQTMRRAEFSLLPTPPRMP